MSQRVSKAEGLLDSLPLPILSLILQRCSSATRRSLLQVSRLTRDTVLGDARSLELTLSNSDTPATCKPLARLLGRICSGRSERLALVLDATKMVGDSAQHLLLPSLLHHGLCQRGWQSVREVTVKGFKCTTPSLLLACAFPALERLAVVRVPLSYMDLEHLSACTHLTSLDLAFCNLTAESASSQGTLTSPLAAVSSIRQLTLKGVSSTIAHGLSQLTSLHLESAPETLADCIRSTNGMYRLQELRVVSANSGWTQRAGLPMLQQLVPTAAQLRVLQLPCSFGQQEMDWLLAHAPQLTHLTCSWLDVTEDRSQSACSWVELTVLLGDFSELAYLPLRNIQRLSWGGLQLPSPSSCVQIALSADQQEISRIRGAVTNLGRCPAWQLSGSDVTCDLSDEDGDFDDVQSLMQTVAALSGLTNRQLEMCIGIEQVLFDASLPQQLGRAFGSSLTHLEVITLNISRDFWPAVWAHLPGLQHLSIGYYHDHGTVHIEDIAAFCTHAARPLQLSLPGSLKERVGSADKLQELSSIWGFPQVTISFY